jgi:hypothetical protein
VDSEFKVGDKVVLYLNEVIEENKKKRASFHHLLPFWKAINGKKGTIEKIDGDNIWVRGNNTNQLRCFTRKTLKYETYKN